MRERTPVRASDSRTRERTPVREGREDDAKDAKEDIQGFLCARVWRPLMGSARESLHLLSAVPSRPSRILCVLRVWMSDLESQRKRPRIRGLLHERRDAYFLRAAIDFSALPTRSAPMVFFHLA